ncbi:MAG: hydrogenase maturation protease [Propionibacteriaceae bacterium]|nr:hydrogenase maturation protease [Propionibacteriaceae bacterium]
MSPVIDESLRDGFAVTVMGVGNPLMGDDGVGLALLEVLTAKFDDPRIDFVDGGTAGLELVPVVQDSTRLLILDAVAGSTPGEVVQLAGDQIPRLLSSKLSPHQVGLLDIFTSARLLGGEPDELAVVGVVPDYVGPHLGLGEKVQGALAEAESRATRVIQGWLDDIDQVEVS